MKLQRNFFIRSTIYLLALRNPLIIITILLYIFTGKYHPKKFLSHILPFLLMLLPFIFYSLVMGNDISNIFGQAKDILLCIVVFCFLLVTSESSDRNNEVVYRALKRCFVTIATLKVLIILYTAKTGIPVSDVIDWIRDKWNIQMMSLGVQDSIIFRLQIPLDSSVPFFIYFTMKEFVKDSQNKKKNALTVLMLIISMLLTLSRAFWAETVLFMMMFFLLETSVSSKVKVIFTTMISASIIFFLTPVGTIVSNIFDSRFGSSNSANSASDAERVWQNNALIRAFLENPVFGHGLGYYIPDAIRSQTTKYLYESQTLSMLMDLGVAGCSVFLALILFYIFRSVKKDGANITNCSMSLLFFLCWLFSGSVNPLLFGVSGGVMLFMSAKFSTLYTEKKGVV